MGRCNLLATVCALALLGPAACGTSGGVGRGVARTGPTASAPAAATVPAASTPASSPAPTRSARRESGWTATVYYTAVQRFHTGPATRVTGCPVLDCRRGGADLGSYPGDFVKAVRDEGTGRTTAGRYLNWSSDVGFWLDDAPRNGHGGALVPFTSAAADADVLAAGTRVRLRECGRDDDGTPIDLSVCTRLRAADWRIDDEFTPGLGGARHVDLYIGEETGPGFTNSPWYTTLHGATVELS